MLVVKNKPSRAAKVPLAMGEITELIQRAGSGSTEAVERLFELLYADLKRLAHTKLRTNPGPALLDTTTLLHESYLRLIKLEELQVQDRAHFMAYAARVMRSVVVDMVRENSAVRRGGGFALVTLATDAADATPAADEQILAVHEALAELANIDERLVRVVEMRYFVGLEMEEIALALGIGKRTVERDWEKARSFLFRAMNGG